MAATTLNRTQTVLSALALIAVALLPSTADPQTAIRSDFDHDSTSFPLDGAHAITNCGDCHSRGVFAGTGRECEDCHRSGGIVMATAKPAQHILASERCENCHATRSFVPVRRMDHNEVVGTCVSCHNNRIARGKFVGHPPASDECDDCHLTVAFSPQVLGSTGSDDLWNSILLFERSRLVSACSDCGPDDSEGTHDD